MAKKTKIYRRLQSNKDILQFGRSVVKTPKGKETTDTYLFIPAKFYLTFAVLIFAIVAISVDSALAIELAKLARNLAIGDWELRMSISGI